MRNICCIFCIFQISHIDGLTVGDQTWSVERILDECWQTGMMQPALKMYKLAKEHLLVRKAERANMQDVVEEIKQIKST